MSAPPALRRAGAVVALALLLLAAFAAGRRDAPLRREAYVFGTLASIELDGPRDAAAAAADAIERLFAARGREWHPWEPSALTALNSALERGEPGTATPSIAALLERSRPLVRESGGRFDPAAGRLVALWGFHTGDWPARAPAPDAAALAAWRAAPDRIDELAPEGLALRPARPGIRVDLNAVAEGAAVEEAAAIVAAHGLDGALLNLGGDVLALGTRQGRRWRVGLADGGGGVLGVVALGDGEALFSSGAYARFRDDGGRRRPHVVDPRSGEPAAGARLAAVLHRDPVRADAAATALMVAGPAEWAEVVRGMALGCALLLGEDGRLRVTRAFAARLEALAAPGPVETLDAGPGCGDPR